MTSVPTLQEIYDGIEGQSLFVEANLASGYRMFRSVVRGTPSFHALLDALDSPEVRARVVARVKNLAESEVDTRFEHPWDVALSAYVTALAEKNLFHGRIAMNSARHARNTWWLGHTLRSIPTVDDVFSTDPRGSGTTTVSIRSPVDFRTTGPAPVFEPQAFGNAKIDTLEEPYKYGTGEPSAVFA